MLNQQGSLRDLSSSNIDKTTFKTNNYTKKHLVIRSQVDFIIKWAVLRQVTININTDIKRTSNIKDHILHNYKTSPENQIISNDGHDI